MRTRDETSALMLSPVGTISVDLYDGEVSSLEKRVKCIRRRIDGVLSKQPKVVLPHPCGWCSDNIDLRHVILDVCRRPGPDVSPHLARSVLECDKMIRHCDPPKRMSSIDIG
jgi:hypothetical protein